MDPLDELKNLPPKQRLARLKELEEARKREIVEAHRLLDDTVQELVEEEEKRAQIPIDQLKAEDESILFTREEREMFRTKHFVTKKAPAQTVEAAAEEEEGPTGETVEERRKRLEQIAKLGGRRIPSGALKQYGSELSKMLDEGRVRYMNPHEVVAQTTDVLENTVYSRELTDEEKWKTYGDAKSLHAALEQGNAPSEELKYIGNALQKFADRMKAHYRTG